MLYLNTKHLKEIGINWSEAISEIKSSLVSIYQKDFSQPIKPYLRYKDPKNRIIAMPAYLGGKVEKAGIKWIASFPENIKNGVERAHSITVLNESDTGIPCCIINSGLISGIRTASVTGCLIAKYLEIKPQDKFDIGIVGFGPIGQLHAMMAKNILGSKLGNIRVFDLNSNTVDDFEEPGFDNIIRCDSWAEVFDNSDIFMTCTVSKKSYIDREPRLGSLQLNVSLRDYVPGFRDYVQHMVVDDWDEVCRENTDIEVMYQSDKLHKEDTMTMEEAIIGNGLSSLKHDDVIMFNPMGMAVFDIAISSYYMKKANEWMVGQVLG